MSDPTIHLPVGEDVTLAADLAIPPRARGLVLFAHGSGSSRHSPRNRFVASVLQRAGLATLLLDLLTTDEERADATTGAFRFDVGLLARRLGAVTERMADEPELRRREEAYRGSQPPPDVRGKVAILVDDGLATGSTMRAAVRAVRQLEPARVVVAVPVAAASTRDELGSEVDEIVCSTPPEPFLAVGRWYEDFSQTSDDEVSDLLERAERGRGTVTA
jgi:hypothetical protein